MGSLHERNISLWVGTTPETDYPSLAGDLSVDVAVIGAGITGLSTAILLKQAGARVAVIAYGPPGQRIASEIRRRGGTPVELGEAWFDAQAQRQRALWETAT